MAKRAYDWLSKALRRLYSRVINEQIPETMQELIDRLDNEPR